MPISSTCEIDHVVSNATVERNLLGKNEKRDRRVSFRSCTDERVAEFSTRGHGRVRRRGFFPVVARKARDRYVEILMFVLRNASLPYK